MTQTAAHYASQYTNVASPRFGTRVTETSDDFFAAKERILTDADPVFIADKYDDHGKWMDGWESRRRRDGGHDWITIRLGAPARLHGVDINTSFFTGNYPPGAELQACGSKGDQPDGNWVDILERVDLAGDSANIFAIDSDETWTWLRLNIYPDGGVARLRLWGEAVPDWSAQTGEVELSALCNGGRVIGFNDAHYGDVWAILAEGRGINMGDGWETRRRRQPGHDWLVMALGARGTISRVEIDTAFFRGNFPDGASLQVADLSSNADVQLDAEEGGNTTQWTELLPRQKLTADTIHHFGADKLTQVGPVTHVRINIYPDGGVSRLRIFGTRTP